MRLTYRVGFNSGGKYKTEESGRRLKVHQVWREMLRRCYGKRVRPRDTTYLDCTVDERWHDFQVFAEWYINHEYSDLGYQLDKDILVSGNRVYSPDFCCFVPAELNSLLTSCAKVRGALPQGVCWDKQHDRYRAQMNMNGRYKYLGLFNCVDEASEVYKTTKEDYVKEKALEWQDRIAPEVFDALMAWKLT